MNKLKLLDLFEPKPNDYSQKLEKVFFDKEIGNYILMDFAEWSLKDYVLFNKNVINDEVKFAKIEEIFNTNNIKKLEKKLNLARKNNKIAQWVFRPVELIDSTTGVRRKLHYSERISYNDEFFDGVMYYKCPSCVVGAHVGMTGIAGNPVVRKVDFQGL